jgi:CHAD domain-containing protein
MRNWENTLATALNRQWRNYRKALERCQRDFSEGPIHASRIEARRLAAQLELLRVFAQRRALEKAHRSIKRHLDTFDRLRDAHVQLIILKKECVGIRGSKVIRKITAKREQRCQREAERRIRRVKTRRLGRVVELLIERLHFGGKNPERMRLDRRTIIRNVDAAFARVVECHRHMNAAEPVTIHRTRVAFKHFRYMMESMRLLLPEITLRRLAAMKAFQDVLGELQDTDVFLARVNKLIAKKRVEVAEVVPFRRWLVRRHVRHVNRCLHCANVVFKFWPLKSARKEME